MMMLVMSSRCEGCHPEEGESPPRDRTTESSADAVAENADAACSILILIHATKDARCRTVPHPGFAGAQDDIIVFVPDWERQCHVVTFITDILL